MYFELQLSADVFTRIVRNRIKALPLCIDREFIDVEGKLTGVSGTLVVIDRVEIGDVTTIQREQIDVTGPNPPQTFTGGATQVAWIFSPTNYTSYAVPFLQVKQQIYIHLVRATDLEANGPNATPPVKSFGVNVVFNVALSASNQTQGGGPLTMSYAMAHIDYGILYGLIPAQQRNEIQQFMAGLNLPPMSLDLGALSSMLKRPVTGINAGIVCDPTNAFVALRVDFDVYNSPIAVTEQFFTTPPENLLDGRDWAMLIDRDALVTDAHAKAKKALESDSKIKLESGPHVSWDPGGPAIDIQADVELVNACPFFVDDMDMDVDVEIRVQMSVPTPNTVKTHYHLEGSPSDIGEVIACAITGAFLWPFIGPLFLKDEDLGIGIGAYIGGLAAGPALTFLGIIGFIETKKLSKDIADKLGDTCKKIDDENYECNDVVHAVMQLTPGFNSRLEIERVAGVQRGLVFGGAISNLRDLLMGSLEPIKVCPFKWQVLGRCTGNGKSNFRIGNQGSIHVFGTPPAGLCHARVLDDPQQEFMLSVADGAVTIVPRFLPAYVANPYPCRVRVVTNRGVRTITLQPPVAKTAAEAATLDDARLSAHLGCYYWEEMFTPVEKIKWRPDPPFDRDRFVQFWQIAVRGLQQEEAIRVRSDRGVQLLRVKPSRSGVAHFALLLSADQAQAEIELELEGRRGDRKEQREISLQQVLFEHRATLPLVGPVRAMRFEGGTHRRRLVVVHEDRESTWDLRNPVAPALVQSVPVLAGRAHSTSVARDDQSERRLAVHSGKRIDATPGPNVFRALGRLLDRHGAPEVVGSPRLGGAKETLYVRSKNGATLYDISDDGEPREMHTYDQPAWFEGIAMGGRIVARHDSAAELIEIYVAALSKECS
jgi:hypothetical protein